MLIERARWRRDDRIAWREERRRLYESLLSAVDTATRRGSNPRSKGDLDQVKRAVDQLTLMAPEEILPAVEALASALLDGQDTTLLRTELVVAARRDLGSAPARRNFFGLPRSLGSNSIIRICECGTRFPAPKYPLSRVYCPHCYQHLPIRATKDNRRRALG